MKISSDRIAFVLPSTLLLDHFIDIWLNMSPETIAIVLSEPPNEEDFTRTFLIDYLLSKGFSSESIGKLELIGSANLIENGPYYPVVVSNQRLGLLTSNSVEHLVQRGFTSADVMDLNSVRGIEAMGRYQVRFPYGGDTSYHWSHGEWNEIYDHFLCIGSQDEARLKVLFPSAEFSIIGYPKYGDFWSPNSGDLGNVQDELYGADNLVTWLPTFSEHNSVVDWIEIIVEVGTVREVVVRPHKFTAIHHPDQWEMILDSGLKVDSFWERDLSSVYQSSATILCDFGGSVTSALYLDKDIICLEVPTMEKEWWAEGSNVVAVREQLGIQKIKNGAPGLMFRLSDALTKERQVDIREHLRRDIYGPRISDPVGRTITILEQILVLQMESTEVK